MRKTTEPHLVRGRDEDSRLTAFQNSLLVLVGAEDPGGISPYDIEGLIREGVAGVLGYSKSQVYKEIKALAERGYLESTVVPGRPRNRTVYTITMEGVEVVR